MFTAKQDGNNKKQDMIHSHSVYVPFKLSITYKTKHSIILYTVRLFNFDCQAQLLLFSQISRFNSQSPSQFRNRRRRADALISVHHCPTINFQNS